MVPDTLAEGLGRYRIGEKVRGLRQAKGLGLAQLGEHSGLSPAMLSKIERGVLFPTLPTLLRIAMVFGVGLDHFFVAAPRPVFAVVRKADRLRLPDRAGSTSPAYFFESLDFPVTQRRVEAYYAEFATATAASEPHRHDGAELVYVLGGALALTVDGEETVLGVGDAVYFDSGVPHAYRRHSRQACSAMVVIAPAR